MFNNKKVYNLCKLIYKESKNNISNNFIKRKILDSINKESISNNNISPVINKKIEILIDGFSSNLEISEFIKEFNYLINNIYFYILINSKIETIVFDDKLIILAEYNEVNSDFFENLLSFLTINDENNILFETLNFNLVNVYDIEPYHVEFKGIDDIKKILNKK